MIEVYNEKVYDLLLERNKEYGKFDIPASGEIPDLTEKTPVDSIEFRYLYESACEYRTTASTLLNDASSRSHLIIIFKVTHISSSGLTLTSKFFLVDLAGSENISLSGSENNEIMKREATSINQSLLTLERLIIMLSKGNSVDTSVRESVLTMLLRSIFSGSKISIICCCSPALSHLNNTRKTLRFGTTAKRIKVTAKANVVETVDTLKVRITYLEGENKILRDNIEALCANTDISALATNSNSNSNNSENKKIDIPINIFV